MSVSSFFDQLGANEFSGFEDANTAFARAGDGELTKREGTEAMAAFLQDQFESGALSDASVNPAITGYLNSVGVNERRRQDELLAYLANSGMNEAQARGIIAEDDVRGQRELSSALAGFQDQLQDERYRALGGLTSYAAAESASEKANYFDAIWRLRNRRDQKSEAKKQRRGQTIQAFLVPLAGYGASAGTQFGTNAQQNAYEQQQTNQILGALNSNGGGSGVNVYGGYPSTYGQSSLGFGGLQNSSGYQGSLSGGGGTSGLSQNGGGGGLGSVLSFLGY